jgi:hypothetical protein
MELHNIFFQFQVSDSKILKLTDTEIVSSNFLKGGSKKAETEDEFIGFAFVRRTALDAPKCIR